MSRVEGVLQMKDISSPAPFSLVGEIRDMLLAMNDHWKWHVSKYNLTGHYVLWHEVGCHHEYTWLTTELMEDMKMAVEYLYHHRIGGQQIKWQPKGYWLDEGYKALAGI
jgi:hypothetical protein